MVVVVMERFRRGRVGWRGVHVHFSRSKPSRLDATSRDRVVSRLTRVWALVMDIGREIEFFTMPMHGKIKLMRQFSIVDTRRNVSFSIKPKKKMGCQ